MIVSGLLAVSVALSFLCLLLPRTSENKIVWIPIVFLIQMGVYSVVLGVLAIFKVGYSPWVIILASLLIVIVSLSLYRHCHIELTLHIRGLQKPNTPSTVDLPEGKQAAAHNSRGLLSQVCCRDDAFSLLTIVVIAILCAIVQFGFPSEIAFNTTDPANHLISATKIYEGGAVESQYLTHLLTAIMLSIIAPGIDPFCFYQVFILEEVFLFIISGMMFYSLLALLCKHLNIIAKIALIAFYMLGYPLNNMIFGFSYLGASVTIIGAILFLCELVSKEKAYSLVVLFGMIGLLLYELIISYVLFAPAIFLGVYIVLVRCLRKTKSWPKALIYSASVFVVPLVLGFLVMYIPVFGVSVTKPTGVITWEGAIFKDLYAGFIVLAPISFYGAITSISRTRAKGLNIPCVMFFLFSIALFVAAILGKTSSYYFFKIYYVLWLVFFVYFAVGASFLGKSNPRFLASYLAVWLTLFALAVSGLDNRLSVSRAKYHSSPIADTLFPVYKFNIENINRQSISADALALFEDADQLVSEGHSVMIISDDYGANWFNAVLSDNEAMYYWRMTDEEIQQALSSSEYVLIREYSFPAPPTRSGTDVSEVRNWVSPEAQVIASNDAGVLLKQFD